MNVALDPAERQALLQVAGGCLLSKTRRAARVLTRFYDRHFTGSGLEPTQFNLLVAIRLTEPVPIVRLANRLGLERTTFTRNLQLLEREGLVTVGRGEDTRQRLLSLTADGRQRLKNALPKWKQAQQAAIELLGERKFNQLSEALSLPTEFNQFE